MVVSGTLGVISEGFDGRSGDQGRFGGHWGGFEVNVSGSGFRIFLGSLCSFICAGLALEGLDPSPDVPLAVEGTHVAMVTLV